MAWNGVSVEKTRYEIVKSVVWLRIVDLNEGKVVADDIKMFVKPEPHKLEKLAEGRLRLISGVSMVDSIVDKILFGDLFDAAMQAVGKTPVLLGWNPLVASAHKLLLNQFPDGVVSVDKSAWDWTVPAWLVDVWLEFVLEMYYAYPSWFLDLIKIRFKCLFEEAVFRCGNTRKKQGVKGIMKSGCYLTYILNSLGQVAVHYAVCGLMGLDPEESMPFACGDDTVQNNCFNVQVYADFMRTLGFNPKIQPVSRHIEFIGFLMDYEKVVPAYWRKHLFQLKYLDEEKAIETLTSYQMFYRYNPEMLNIVQEELRRRDPRAVLSSRFLRHWADHGVKVMSHQALARNY